ncbi:hypothetical protein [Desmospora profundinema]|uniref:Uncharacterized protein n=1 Tax=Desmospora profundinema TaxID=1571184 RepID=A0ABU1ITP6_9BACL|nr:hypothetical protein [Desmospora profundinema]MDR6227559.1 hypothetical protein [Desmospora profundinema]
MEKLSYEDFVQDLNTGHDIEFEYIGKKYSITNSQDGFSLCEYNSSEPITFASVAELLEKAKISGRTIKEIWPEIKVKDIF